MLAIKKNTVYYSCFQVYALGIRIRKRNDLLDLLMQQCLNNYSIYLHGVVDETFIVLLYCVSKVD